MSKDGVDVDGVGVREQEEGGLGGRGGFQVGDATLDTGVEGERAEGVADVLRGRTGGMELEEKVSAEVGELLRLLTALKLSTKRREEHFVNVSVGVLVDERPAQWSHSHLEEKSSVSSHADVSPPRWLRQ